MHFVHDETRDFHRPGGNAFLVSRLLDDHWMVAASGVMGDGIMSFVIAAPDLVQDAAQDLAGIRASLADTAATIAGPTTGVVPGAADEVSAAIAALFSNFGQDFQLLTAQAQTFHAEFASLIRVGAGAYLGTEVANAEQALTNAVGAPVEALFSGALSAGSGGGAAAAASSGGLLGLVTGLAGTTGGGSGLGGLIAGTGFGGALGSLGGLGSRGKNLNSLLAEAFPGLPGTLTGFETSLTGVVNSLLPGLVQVQLGAGPAFTGIAGPYEALFANTWNNLHSLASGWLADPFPFLRQFVANQVGYAQIFATALASGNVQPIFAIPGDIAHNMTNVVETVTNTGATSSLDLAIAPPSATLDVAVGLPLVFGASLIGPPVATLQAAGSSASAFLAAVQAGDPAGAFAAIIDAPAVIANGFLNGQATFPYALHLSSLTGPAVGSIADLSVVGNFPLDGILHPPGYYPVTITVTDALNPLAPPIVIDAGVGGTPFTGLLPFLINYAPLQLAQAIGAPASPQPLVSLPIITF